MRIILALEKDEKNFTEIKSIVSKDGVGQISMNHALDTLEEADLIQRVEVRYKARIYELTEKGRDALNILRQLINLLEE